ncbi:hypothetical protein LUZ60_006982 [Juncus effusus]|nr:hypothetical protein LUZ60_006982 [Juncus effusus]
MSELRFIKAVCANVLKNNWPLLSHAPISTLFTPSNVTQILHQLSSQTSLSWAFFNWADSLPHYSHSLEPNWAMVHLLTENNQFEMAQELLEKFTLKSMICSPLVLGPLLKSYPSTSGQVLNWLVIYYSKCSLSNDALKVFDEMKSHGLKPDSYACNALLIALAKDKNIHTAWKVFDEIVELGIVLNIHIYNSLLYICFKSNDLNKARELVSEMEKNGVLLNAASYNNLVMLLCNKGLNRQALSLLYKMKGKGFNPDIITFNFLINGFCKERRIEEAVKLLKEINGGISPNEFTYETLIRGYCRVKDYEAAIGLFNEMKTKGLYPDLLTYNFIISEFCNLGKMERANELLDEMFERKIKPDFITIKPLINAYFEAGDLDSVLKIKNNRELKLHIVTYKQLIEGFCEAEKLDVAKETLLHMIDEGRSPTYSTVSFLVDCFCSQNKTDEILAISEKIQKKDHNVCKALYTALILSLCKRGLINNAQKVLDEMLSKEVYGNCSYAVMTFAYIKEGKTDEALKVLNEMVEKKMDISEKTFRFIKAEFIGDSDALKQLRVYAKERGLIAKKARRLMTKKWFCS